MDGFFLSHQNKLGQPQKCMRILRQRSWLCAASDFLSISAHRTEMRGRLNPMELIQHTNTQKKKPSENRPGVCKQYEIRKKTQRLLNCGARRAAFKPYCASF